MSDLTKRWPFGLNRRNWPDYLAFFIFALFVLLFFDVYASRSATAWAVEWRQPFQFVTHFGLSEWVLVPSGLVFLVSFLMFRFWGKTSHWRRAIFELSLLSGFIFAAVAGTGLITAFAKRILGRGRPTVYDDFGAFDFQYIFNDWTFQSFPSGHSTTAMATAIVVGFLAPRFFRLFLIIALVTGVSRVVTGDHYPTDVLAGFAVGALGTYAIRNLFARRRWLFRPTPGGKIRFTGVPALRRLLQRALA
ncbi:PAP2 superfamily protein [Devosia crocina]|uniref:PAP2 superfamily protein n=1 Tax=Devosia crocina TaxID=429728 RepID=A0A1I7NEH3_9HYPH|nr:phosphatase PAP2 family protein [Devosia crocina]SFV33064.1 PAP2 superfamily protein [Devosia crocina]